MRIKVQCELPKESLVKVFGGIGTSPFDPKKGEEESKPEATSGLVANNVSEMGG
ncbi:hypothetical protein WLQ65_06605 [Pseudoalteromonas piscicida]|uniref:hypothetical protein n=1 Tax=Pseudoalteromonas TaxID=53246 RepID=UPI0015519E1C|nr:hypothetical protein [Pseudoalteromonas sp. GCY]QQQ65954.1 hypothetical protein JJQ94_16780 [Pseudoalteromonas sp. GCY]